MIEYFYPNRRYSPTSSKPIPKLVKPMKTPLNSNTAQIKPTPKTLPCPNCGAQISAGSLLGSIQSKAKRFASRKNGIKGGRPPDTEEIKQGKREYKRWNKECTKMAMDILKKHLSPSQPDPSTTPEK